MSRLHRMRETPAGQFVGDSLPAFAGGEHAVHLGEPDKDRPGCRKPFTEVRKSRRSIISNAFIYRICGSGWAECRKGGKASDAMLAAIHAFTDSAEATQ